MKKNVSQKFFLAFRLIISSVFFVFLFAIIFSKQVSAQGTAAPDSAPQAPAPSADTKAKQNPNKNKKTTIDFEDQLIEGSRQKPELFYLLQNKDFNYKRLIRLREDFLPELRKSSEDVQGRSGSGQ